MKSEKNIITVYKWKTGFYTGKTEWKNQTGNLDRKNGPAIEWSNGDKEWWVDGKRHREDGPAIVLSNGSKSWYINGKLHRENGPAIEYRTGSKEWRINGKRHREDGPAYEGEDGTKEWWFDGKMYTEEDFNKMLLDKQTCEMNEYKSFCKVYFKRKIV